MCLNIHKDHCPTVSKRDQPSLLRMAVENSTSRFPYTDWCANFGSFQPRYDRVSSPTWPPGHICRAAVPVSCMFCDCGVASDMPPSAEQKTWHAQRRYWGLKRMGAEGEPSGTGAHVTIRPGMNDATLA